MGAISFSYNPAKQNLLSISKENQGLGCISIEASKLEEIRFLNLYTDGSTYYPSTVSSQGSDGQLASDGDFLYYSAGNNNWRRLALATW